MKHRHPATKSLPVVVATPKSRWWRGSNGEERLAGYLFLLPNLIGFLIFSLIPILSVFFIALTDWNLASSPRFIGFNNFTTLFRDDLFWKTAGNTAYYTIGAVPAGVAIAFGMALLLNQKLRGIVFFRTLFFLPHVTLTVAVAIVWTWIYNPNLGIINYSLGLIGIDGPSWLQSSVWAMPAIIVMSNWMGIGYAMLVFLAALQSVPEEYYEAARFDGATWFQQLRNITLPLLSPTTFFLLITSFMGAMQAFDQFYVMTQGGPAYSTTTLVMYTYQNGFEFFRMGYAAANATMLFLGIIAVTAVQWRLSKRWVYAYD